MKSKSFDEALKKKLEEFVSREKDRKFYAEFSESFTEILATTGWPGMSTFGWDLAKATAGIVRGCTAHPDFMRRSLFILEQAYRFGEAAGEWFAFHYDTIMFFELKPQVYGTYLHWDRNGRLSPWKIVDPAGVDLRRAAIQMEPLEDYVHRAREEAAAAGMKPPADLTAHRSSLSHFAHSAGWKRACLNDTSSLRI